LVQKRCPLNSDINNHLPLTFDTEVRNELIDHPHATIFTEELMAPEPLRMDCTAALLPIPEPATSCPHVRQASLPSEYIRTWKLLALFGLAAALFGLAGLIITVLASRVDDDAWWMELQYPLTALLCGGTALATSGLVLFSFLRRERISTRG
jgi:hypothetical protein